MVPSPATVAGDLLDVVITAAAGPDLPPSGRTTSPPASPGGSAGADTDKTRGYPRHHVRADRGGSPRGGITVLRLLATAGRRGLIVIWGASWFTFVVGLIVAGSDGLDGYMARRQGTTRSGAFLDPLADKVVRARCALRPGRARGICPGSRSSSSPSAEASA